MNVLFKSSLRKDKKKKKERKNVRNEKHFPSLLITLIINSRALDAWVDIAMGQPLVTSKEGRRVPRASSLRGGGHLGLEH